LECVESTLRNYLIIQGLAEKYNFSYDFFLQPVLPVGNKVLSEWEQKIYDNSDPSLRKSFKKFYNLIGTESDKYPNLHYITNIFDSLSFSVYTDIMHITPAGNKIIANKIAETIFNGNEERFNK
jgi:hypothetical protein